MPKGSDLLVAALENEGVDRIFGVPGEENLDVVESLRNSSIKLILTRHEQGAAFMAATYGRLTGKPGVCITTLGPGALNLTTGAAYALLGAMPMIMLTGQKGIMSSRQAKFQIVDVVSAFKPLTKLSLQIVSTTSIPTIVRDAFRIAMEERPGPVLLELPEDIAGEEAEDVAMVPQHPIEIPVAHRASLDRAADMILKAKRHLIMLGAAASRPRNFPQCEVVGDVGPSLELLADRLEGRLHHAGALLSLREGILARIGDRATEDRWPPTPQRIVHDVRRVIPEDGVVALDNGMYKIWFARNYRTYVANTLLLDNALATMGAGLPSAMMAAMLHPERRVLAVCGDGGFMMNSQEMETAVRLKLNLVVLILEDSAYGMIRWKQAVDSFPDFGLTFDNPDFVKYAESYGARGSRVESTDSLIPTLENAFKGGGVHLVVVPIDYSENTRVLVDELREKLKQVVEPAA